MGHLTSIRNLSGKFPPQLLAILEEFRRQLEELNAFEYWEDVAITTPAVGTEFLVETNYLNKTPQYYLVIKKSAAVDVYDGGSINTHNKLYLKASVEGVTITVRVVA